MAHPTKSRQRGAGYIEVLASSLILALSLLAALSLFGFSMTLVGKTGDEGVAYNICRLNIENARQLGFDYHNLPEDRTGTTFYYDNLGQPLNSAPTEGFKAVRTVTSDEMATLGSGGQVPSDDALRTVVVVVTQIPSNQQVEQSGTILARSGV